MRSGVALFALLALLAVLAGAVKHTHAQHPSLSWDTEESIEAIGNKHFSAFMQHHQRAGTWEALHERGLDVEDLKPHRCMHDAVMHTTGQGKRVAAIAQAALEAKQARSAEEREADAREEAARALKGFEQIRIGADTSRISNPALDSDYTCTSAAGTFLDYTGQTDAATPCSSQDVLTTTIQNFLLNSMIPALVEVATSLLGVVPRGASLDIGTGQCFAGVEYTALSVPNTDYYIFFTARPIYDPSGSSGTVANAVPCEFTKSGVPIAGGINFNVQQFQSLPSNARAFTGLLRVGFHELTHALGFTSALYGVYSDSQNSNKRWPNAVVTTTLGTNYPARSYLVTPRVVAFAQAHLACPEVPGFGLESEGGSGTAMSHWKQRLSGDEFMGGFITVNMVISNLTLALFEDMGWYSSNFALGEQLLWGYKQDCAFVSAKCSEATWPYWCTQGSSGCTPDRKAKGRCNVISYASALPSEFQYFSNPALGGLLATVDYCPYNDWASATYCTDTSQNNAALNPNGENYANSSQCFEIEGLAGSGCYQVLCAPDRLSYSVTAFGLTKPCPEGTTISIDSDSIIPQTANIRCGPVSIVCASTSACVDSTCVEDVGGDGGINWLGLTNSSLEFWLIIGLIVVAVIVVVLCVLCCFCDLAKCFCKKSPQSLQRQPPMRRNVVYVVRTMRGRPPLADEV